MDLLRTDFHGHLVPGVDDGSRGVVDTVAMAEGLRALGVERVHLTPHVYRYGNAYDVEQIEGFAAHVRGLLRRAGIDIGVVPGAEYCLGEEFLCALERDDPFVSFEREDERWLLVEIHPRKPIVGLREIGRALLARGMRPLLAHPERHPGTLSQQRLAALREEGWRFQLNLASLVGSYGGECRTSCAAIFDAGWYDVAGSDLHRPDGLSALRAAHRALRGRARTPNGTEATT